ncbi:alpha-L-rhamnosidase [Halosimplex carlsbadense 2-9-1]|uniref:alpha-L-rhamnosidase n=1 Tax=Halosimplex carlsbadense 2-9-1 TaxID=797114 RepID=M0CDC0_9EURY|nr:family 78 glycoside hydrolase catalytic domain [Halosimplex carlsbadense]ELZ19874.1 alpha-L-rhamnosidase [Halosimplex carlsbadense 2-9-1]
MNTSPDERTSSAPTDLTVEYERAPGNVDPTDPPRFGWRAPTGRRGARQTAYRVVVGRDRERVAGGRGDLWDSGRVESDRATSVVYEGPGLAADATYYWSVKLWTDGGATPWADPAEFATALSPEDWRGEWIAHQPGAGDTNGWRSRWRDPDAVGDGEGPWVQVDLGAERELAAIELHPADPVTVVRTPDDYAVATSWRDDPLVEFGFPDAYRVELSDDPEFETATTVADVVDDSGSDVVAPTDDDELAGQSETVATARTHDAGDARGRYVRVTATDLPSVTPASGDPSPAGEADRLVESHDEWACFALAGLTVEDGDGIDFARGGDVTASSTVETEAWGRAHLVDGVTESRMAATAPLLRHEFALEGVVASARVHVAAVGYGELYCNGERVGDRRLDPVWTDYESRVPYATHDVTDRLTTGENALGIWLGRGWFGKRSAHWLADGSPRARAVLTVEFEDGRTRRIATGPDWQASASPITANDIYDGETYDARRERPGWAAPASETAAPGFDDADWDPASVVDAPGGALRPQRVEPMAVVETFEPESVRDHPDGPILDFGQNLTGHVELAVEGAAAGDEITLRHAEALTDAGDLSTTDLRSADATDTYVARGDDHETYEPRFTYHGFRYAQVSGYPGEGEDGTAGLDPADVTAKVVHTAMDRRGSFDCSNDDLSRVQHNAVWGLRGNTHGIPEDCPQRDERFGWTGDAQISTRALLFNFDAVRFEEKWQRDHADAASEMGYVPDVIPDKSPENPADPTWSVTRVLLPWHCYRHDGDLGILREHYEGMRDYVDYWLSVADDGILPGEYGKYGDWLAFENTDPEEPRRGLPHDLYNTAFLFQVTETFAKVAAALDNGADAERYRGRAEDVAEAFREAFFDADAGEFGPGTQSSFAVPLFLGLVPDGEVDRVVANLVEKVRSDGAKLKTGFLGTRPLIHTLAAHGYPELAYEVVSQPERPGWVYMAQQGATTMWERWDSDDSVGSGMNSLNHSPFTHVSEFFYEVLAGLRIGDDPVTDHVEVAPALVDDLDWAEATVETPNGELASAWERADEGYELSVTVPWNATATVRLPDAAEATVRESGTDPSESAVDGVASVDDEGGDLVVEVGAGTYEFTVA